MKDIIIKNVYHGNLKNLDLTIPRNKLVVITGLSGSGKSTLAIDVLYQECQRQYLEAISFQGINKPGVEVIRNVSPAVVITQDEKNNNPRSSLGTVTDIYTDIRMIYEKLGVRKCPHCGKMIDASYCHEELVRADNDFTVYMYCNYCHYKMEKLTRSHFSFNSEKGACPTCFGLGKTLILNLDKVLEPNLSLREGAVAFWHHRYKEYQIEQLEKVYRELGLSVTPETKVIDFNQQQRVILLYGTESKQFKELFGKIKISKFEGIITNLWRRVEEKKNQSKEISSYFDEQVCPDCHGEKLNSLSRQITVNKTVITATTKMPLTELLHWLEQLEATVSGPQKEAVQQYIIDLKTKIQRIINVGLGYLHLDRQTMTLSGGEKQRIKLAAALQSQLTGIIYIFDEPTMGLHPKDTAGIINVLKELRDQENTVIVIEHDLDVIKAADYLIDLGPGAGKHGGQILALGTYHELQNNPSSITGQYFVNKKKCKRVYRTSNRYFEVKNAHVHNLKNIDVTFLVDCLNVVTGVSGSGKSTLVFAVLAKQHYRYFDDIIAVRQESITTTRRSNIATYTGIYDEIRKLFGSLEATKEMGFTAKHFSFNSQGGRCENCEGLGTVTSNMLFFKDVEVVCPACQGKRFIPEILALKYHEHSIDDVLHLSVDEGVGFFSDCPKIIKTLKMLQDVGLGYLELGQVLTTLSGGEKQRLKLATTLLTNINKHNLYLIDEPTIGLHPLDIEHLLLLLDRIVDSGNTVVIVEHNQQIINAADWIIDLGPAGGNDGGYVIAAGTPNDIKGNENSIIGEFL